VDYLSSFYHAIKLFCPIEEEKIAAINQIKVQIASLSVEIAEKILRKKLEDDAVQKELMTSLLDEFKLN